MSQNRATQHTPEVVENARLGSINASACPNCNPAAYGGFAPLGVAWCEKCRAESLQSARDYSRAVRLTGCDYLTEAEVREAIRKAEGGAL